MLSGQEVWWADEITRDVSDVRKGKSFRLTG